jgi:uncharacterized protein (TIGR00303 family)
MIRSYTQVTQATQWLARHRHTSPLLACVLGFTETALVPGISAAGATPADRQFTALADAEFLYQGVSRSPTYPLPPLSAGASPTLLTRAMVEAFDWPVQLFNAGLSRSLSVPAIDLGGTPAHCVSSGEALSLEVVTHLFREGLAWGERLAHQAGKGYLILSECVVAGTTTALALLTGLGVDAVGKVNSSYPQCNHGQKQRLVQQGLGRAGLPLPEPLTSRQQVLQLLAAIGDPMQPAVAGMALSASRHCGVLLAGGTQMLAVYAWARAVAGADPPLPWRPEQVVVGTTRWVAEDPSGDTVGLAQQIGDVPLLATALNLGDSRFAQLRAYEQGYVKEGVGAGGCAIAASLWADWGQVELLEAIEALLAKHLGQSQF